MDSHVRFFSLAAVLAMVYLSVGLIRRVRTYREIKMLPIAGNVPGSISQKRQAYFRSSTKVYKDAYEQFKGSLCRVVTTRDTDVILVPPELLPELRKLPDSVLGTVEAFSEILESRYTNININLPMTLYAVKAKLTPSIARLSSIIADATDAALAIELPACPDWTPIAIHAVMLRTVARISGRLFVGPVLCHDATYLDAAVNYTIDLMAARFVVHNLPPWQRPFRAPFLPQVQRLRQRELECGAILMPILEERLREIVAARGGSTTSEKQIFADDMLQWLLECRLEGRQVKKPEGQGKGASGKARRHHHTTPEELTAADVKFIAKSQLTLTFAAIHTTTATMTNVLFSLATQPENAEILRAEIREVMQRYGPDNSYSTAAIQAMKRLDSYVKESSRLYPIAIGTFSRKVLQPLILSNGQRIPAGATIEVSAYGVGFDGVLYPSPTTFQPWRHLEVAEGDDAADQPSGKSDERCSNATVNTRQFVAVTPRHLIFGYGRHACPGRFMAVHEIKVIVARMLLTYDIRNEGFSLERYANIVQGSSYLPDESKILLLKARASN